MAGADDQWVKSQWKSSRTDPPQQCHADVDGLAGMDGEGWGSKEKVAGVPTVAHRKQIRLVSRRIRFYPWPHSVVWGSSVAVSCGIGCSCSSDPAWLWLWCRHLGTSICHRCGPKSKKKKNQKAANKLPCLKEEILSNFNILFWLNFLFIEKP